MSHSLEIVIIKQHIGNGTSAGVENMERLPVGNFYYINLFIFIIIKNI